MRVKRIIKWTTFSLSILCFVLFAAVGFALFTQAGAQVSWRLASTTVEGLQADSISGKLAGPLELKGMTYESDGLSVQLQHGVFDWQLKRLLFGELRIIQLFVDGLNITSSVSEKSEPDSAFELPDTLPIPFVVILDNVGLHNAKIRSGSNAEPLEIRSALLKARLSSGEVHVTELDVDSPLFQVTGEAHSLLWSNFKSQVDLEWKLTLPEQLEATGSLLASGDINQLNYVVDAQANEPQLGQFNLKSEGHASLLQIVVDSMELIHDQSQAAIHVQGRITLEQQLPTADLELSWSDLRWPLGDGPDELIAGSRKGTATLKGTADDYSVDMQATLRTPQTPKGNLALLANGNMGGITIESFDLHVLKGSATGNAEVSWANELRGRFALKGEQFDPGELFPDWPGSVDFAAQGRVDGSTTQINVLNVGGVLRELPIKLDASLSYDGSTAYIPTFNLSSGTSKASVVGEFGKEMDLQWELASPDIGAFHPDAQGSVYGEGRIGGSMPWPEVQVTLKANDVSYEQNIIESLEVDADLDLLSKAQSIITIEAKSAVIAGTNIELVDMQAKGNLDSHRIILEANTSSGDAALSLSGQYKDDLWNATLEKGRLEPDQFAAWELSMPNEIQISEQKQLLASSCWSSGESQVCMQAIRQSDDVSATLDVSSLPFGYFQSLLGPDVEARGSVDGAVKFQQSEPDQWSTNANFETTASTIIQRETAQQAAVELLRFTPGSIVFNSDAQQIQATLNIPLEEGGGALGSLQIKSAGQPNADGSLLGDIKLDVPDLSFLAVATPEIRSVSGGLQIAISLGGTLKKPQPTGRVLVSDVSIALETPGLTIEDISLVAEGDSTGRFEFQSSASSGGGKLSLRGHSELLTEPMKTVLRISGEEFQLWNSADARVWVSPELNVMMGDKLIDVQGELTIPHAEITPKELPQSAVALSADEVIIVSIDEASSVAQETQDIKADIKVVLGDKVSVEGFGFKGKIIGDLDVRQSPSKPILASGELNIVDGEYRAYGQGLVVERGKILFSGGAIDNPGLSVRAVRRPAEGILVGVNVLGELKQPDIKLFSEPGMSQSDQLSWLVLGRAMQNTSGAESDYITQAALVLGIKGGNFLTRDIGKNIGVDSIGIETGSGEAGAASDVNQAALVIGKYLTPKLYVSYGVGLFDSISTVSLRYLLTERWNLVTESSSLASGGDISYSFER